MTAGDDFGLDGGLSAGKAVELIDRSFLTEKLKRKYLSIVKERTARFVRCPHPSETER